MEEDGSKYRLVRCPKCENLLPELHAFSLYKCGGCGAVLQANTQCSASDNLMEKSDKEKGKGVLEKEKQIHEKPISMIDGSLSKSHDEVFVKANNQSSRVETMNLHHKQGKQKDEAVDFDGRYKPYSKRRIDNRVHENGHVENGNIGFSTFPYAQEGSSNFKSNLPHDVGVHKMIENLDYDRAELLRKIDELKIQLTSANVVRDEPRDKGLIHKPMDNLYVHNSYVPEGPYKANMQCFSRDPDVLDPVNQEHKHIHDLNMGNIYSPNRVARPSYQQPYPDQFSVHNMNVNQRYFPSQNCVGSLNRHLCSCFQCYRNQHFQPSELQTTLRSTHHHISSSSRSLHGHDLVSSQNVDFENGSLNGGLLRSVVIAHGTKRICRPRANGAPFLACPSCFVLLNLSKHLTMAPKNVQKVRCGACSELISVEVYKNCIVITFPQNLRQRFTEGYVGYGEELVEDATLFNNDLGRNEFKPIINSQSTNAETNALSRDHSVKSSQSSKRRGTVSSSLSFSDDEPSPDSVIVARESSKSSDLTLKGDPPLQEDSKSADLASKDDSLPLSHHPQKMDYDDDYADFVFSRCGMGNKSKHSSRQNSVKDVEMLTDKEVVGSNMAASMEVSTEEDQPRISEESDSFFGGFIKKSFKDLLRHKQSVDVSRINVFVNGQPLLNRVVKKAEKLAGPIQPGNYWYDYHAGFWGVMGQPCHGIIPPYIEEFNYLMPRKCGAGNTGVFVNGRELHESDLELLACRGLPTNRDKFYIIDISGRVVDEYTGEELDDLGKLAPTVEKVRHGFGMRPRAMTE